MSVKDQTLLFSCYTKNTDKKNYCFDPKCIADGLFQARSWLTQNICKRSETVGNQMGNALGCFSGVMTSAVKKIIGDGSATLATGSNVAGAAGTTTPDAAKTDLTTRINTAQINSCKSDIKSKLDDLSDAKGQLNKCTAKFTETLIRIYSERMNIFAELISVIGKLTFKFKFI